VEYLLDANSFNQFMSSDLIVQNSTRISGLRNGKVEKYEVRSPSSGVQVQYYGPQFDVVGDAPIQSVVKWFNPKRGFGFVILSDGSGDAFLHRNVLAEAGIATVEPRAVLTVRTAWKDQGLQVVEVLSVEDNSAVAATQSIHKTNHRKPLTEEAGTFKSFNTKRGYGFIARAGGRKDVLVHVSTLERVGLHSLTQGQRVFVKVTGGRQGPRAKSIRVVSLGSTGETHERFVALD
jgi:CspA family cold shock protein